MIGALHGDRLVAHIAAYRNQRGTDATPGRGRLEFRHFFIESLATLELARANVAASAGGATLLLDFGPHPLDASYPTVGEFARGVFERVIAGFVAALHIQLGALAT